MTVQRVGDSTARELRTALRVLHLRAGEPSTRSIATGIGSISHTTVNQTLRGDRVPSWPLFSKIVIQLGGDEDEFRDLWAATHDAGASIESLPGPTESLRPDVSVFVSYARVDDKATYERVTKFVASIKRLYESMTGQQVRVFMDTGSIEAGGIWVDRVRLGISSSAVLLAFISPAYLRSAYDREEYREFTSFVRVSSKSRSIVPLLFVERERIEKYFSADEIWLEVQALQPVSVDQLRFEEPGSSEWLRKTQEVVDRIENVLVDLARSADKPTQGTEFPEQGKAKSTAFFEALVEVEDLGPKTIAHLEAIDQLLVRLGDEVSKAAPLMDRATTTKGKLAISRQFACALEPTSTALAEEATGLRLEMNEWDLVVKMIIARVREDPGRTNEGKVRDTFKAIDAMTESRVVSLNSLDDLSNGIGSVKGFSHELDAPLHVIEEALRDIAEVRGTLKGWNEGLAVAKMMTEHNFDC